MVSFDQTVGDPTCIGQVGCECQDKWYDGVHFFLQGLRRGYHMRIRYQATVNNVGYNFDQMCHTSAASCDRPHDGYTKALREKLKVHLDTLASSFIHQVGAHHGFWRNLHHLKHEIQIALQCGRVYDHYNAVRL